MIDKLKKVLGLIGLILICAVSFFIVKTYYPEFYYHTVSLTMAGDINGLSKYIILWLRSICRKSGAACFLQHFLHSNHPIFDN